MTAVNKAKNNVDHAKGKLKEVAGRVTGNHDLRNEGKRDQLLARLKQAGEKVKHAFSK